MSDPYVVCPYNKAHFVSRSRLQAHIVKCEKVYPQLGICPYNATHRVPFPELQDHAKNCPDAYKFESGIKVKASENLHRQNESDSDSGCSD